MSRRPRHLGGRAGPVGGIPEGVFVSWPYYSHDGRFPVALFDEAAVEADTMVARLGPGIT